MARPLIKTSYVVCVSPAHLKKDGQLRSPAEVSSHDCLLFPRHQVTATNFYSRVWCVFPTRSYVPTKVRVFIEQLRAYLAAKGLASSA
jgi:hypothetical protein